MSDLADVAVNVMEELDTSLARPQRPPQVSVHLIFPAVPVCLTSLCSQVPQLDLGRIPVAPAALSVSQNHHKN